MDKLIHHITRAEKLLAHHKSKHDDTFLRVRIAEGQVFAAKARLQELEQSPELKELKELESRIEDLEKRVAEILKVPK
jgi:hypothetical protein